MTIWDLLDGVLDTRSYIIFKKNNLAFQAPIQGKYRDRFKFDKFFVKMWPTVNELVPKLDEYYTNNEQRILYNELKIKFENL